MSTSSGSWSGYIAEDFTFEDYVPGSRVLDVGFGDGRQMRHLREAACRPYGVEHNEGLAARGRAAGLTVCRAKAEELPFGDGAFDGVVCKVVIPYTDEARAIAEIARVLRADGVARVSFHGLGYSLRYLLEGPTWKRRVYAARVIVNTIVYALTGKRLPGFVGDTLYQGRRRLRRCYRQVGLDVVSEHPSPTFAGAPVFIYQTLRRVAADNPAAAELNRATGRS
jgi:SAM-dependent methyltransferase